MGVYLGSNKVGVNSVSMIPSEGFIQNGKLIAEKTYSFKLSDTDYDSKTISTSSQALILPATTYTANPNSTIICHKIGENYDGTVINYDNFDYIVHFTAYWDFVYTQTDSIMNNLIHGKKYAYICFYYPAKWYGINTDGTKKSSLSTSSSDHLYNSRFLYRKVDGTYGTNTTYGIYFNSSSNISVYSDVINLGLSNLYTRSNESYFQLEAMNYIKSSDITMNFAWKIYQGDHLSSRKFYVEDTLDNLVALEGN